MCDYEMSQKQKTKRPRKQTTIYRTKSVDVHVNVLTRSLKASRDGSPHYAFRLAYRMKGQKKTEESFFEGKVRFIVCVAGCKYLFCCDHILYLVQQRRLFLGQTVDG